MPQGTVKPFTTVMGFGFIVMGAPRNEIAVDRKDVVGGTLSHGDRVEFEVATGRKGLQAASVRRLG